MLTAIPRPHHYTHSSHMHMHNTSTHAHTHVHVSIHQGFHTQGERLWLTTKKNGEGQLNGGLCSSEGR